MEFHPEGGPAGPADAAASGAPAPHPDLQPLSFLIGRWAGEGVVGYPTMESRRFRQEVVFEHYGKPYLAYRSRTWLLDTGSLSAVEVGFWRPVSGGVELLLAHPTGIAEIYVGSVEGHKIELHTDVVARTATAKEVSAEHRLYGLVEGRLMYAADLAAVGQSLQPHMSAVLERIPAAGEATGQGTADAPRWAQ